MLDFKLIFKNISFYNEKIKIRTSDLDLNKLIIIYDKYKKIKLNIEKFQSQRKIISKKIFLLKKKRYNFDNLINDIFLIKKKIKENKKKLKIIFKKLNHYLYFIPNIPSYDVPLNKDKILYKYGNIKKYKFKIIDHINFGKISNELNFVESSILSGPNFVVMRNNIATLYRAISQFMINTHVYKKNYNEVYVPYIVKDESLFGTGQLPKFSEDLFYVNSKNNNKFVLIPTAEVPLVNLFRNKILDEKDLPIKLVSFSPCFRAESGSYGKNSRGLIRLHQFDKVELIQVVKPKNSMFFLDKLTSDAEDILKILKLPYRKILLSSKSMSFSSCKTYDIEVWSPVSKSYLEVSSCSNTSDFQSRRIKARFFDKKKKKNIFVHIINGSGLAVGRILLAIIENFQVDEGLIKIPNVLVNYMNGLKYISCYKNKNNIN